MFDPFQELLILINLRIDNATLALNGQCPLSNEEKFLSIMGDCDPVVEIQLLLEELHEHKKSN